jgi:hypothetical protein
LVERKRVKLALFLENLDKSVLATCCFQKSDQRPDQKLFSKEPAVTTDFYKRAFAWTLLNSKSVKQKFSGKPCFFDERTPNDTNQLSTQAQSFTRAKTSTQETETQPKKRGRKPKRRESEPEKEEEQEKEKIETTKIIDKATCKSFIQTISKCEWESFHDFEQSFQQLRVVQLNEDNWKLSTCTCPSWFKHYMCKHIIGISYRQKLFESFPKESWCLTLGQVASAGRPKKMTKALSK